MHHLLTYLRTVTSPFATPGNAETNNTVFMKKNIFIFIRQLKSAAENKKNTYVQVPIYKNSIYVYIVEEYERKNIVSGLHCTSLGTVSECPSQIC